SAADDILGADARGGAQNGRAALCAAGRALAQGVAGDLVARADSPLLTRRPIGRRQRSLKDDGRRLTSNHAKSIYENVFVNGRFAMVRFRKAAVLAFSMLAALAGAASAEDLRIGAIFPLSGGNADYGDLYMGATELAAAHLNEANTLG